MEGQDALDRADMADLASGDDSALNKLMERHAEKLFHYLDNAPTIVKRRFLESYPLQKLFEVYVMADMDRLSAQFRRPVVDLAPPRRGVADDLHDLLDARLTTGLTLDEAAALLHTHPAHLVRAFTRRFGIPPHLYLTGRRVEMARETTCSAWLKVLGRQVTFMSCSFSPQGFVSLDKDS